MNKGEGVGRREREVGKEEGRRGRKEGNVNGNDPF